MAGTESSTLRILVTISSPGPSPMSGTLLYSLVPLISLFAKLVQCVQLSTVGKEAEFLDVIGTKVLRVFFLTKLLYSQSPLLTIFTPPSLSISEWFETGLQCKHCIRKP
jgi:hypothetical protein